MILTAEFEGGQAQYLKFGSGKTLFVMLPGLSLPNVLRSADAVESAYSAFSKDYTVYLFDRIKNPPAGYTLGQMAEDTARSIEAAGIENACVFGASQGGMLALLTAAGHPRLVSKLAVGSTAAKSYKNIQIIMEQWLKLANEKNVRDLAENGKGRGVDIPVSIGFGRLLLGGEGERRQQKTECEKEGSFHIHSI